jgi:hypothetical protein
MLKKQKKYEKREKRRIEERKKVEAEITFKRWKMQKDKETREGRKIKKLEDWREKEQLLLLREQKRMLNQGGDVMLAYSLNKNIREIEKLRKRPKSARMGIRV